MSKAALGRGSCTASLDAIPRYGTPEEIAAFVAFLAGAEAGYIKGANLMTDGGFSA
jgi:NAD(P)-dependent dehydrogenase (short-subunit alcohol dehydrogenase family)